MLIIGLTGSMAMGKSTAAQYLQSKGIPVFDSDRAVHQLYRDPDAAARIERAFPGTVQDGKVDRTRLARAVAGSAEALRRLEDIVHPLVRRLQWEFLKSQHEKGAECVVLDVPLLFESGGEELVDVVIVVSAPKDIQLGRLAARTGLTETQIGALLARQMPDDEKRRRADFIVDTSGSFEETRRQIDSILDRLKDRAGSVYAKWSHRFETQIADGRY